MPAENRVNLRQQRELNFPGPLEVFLHLLVFGPEFLPALSQKRVGAPDPLLRQMLLGDVPENPLQPDDLPSAL